MGRPPSNGGPSFRFNQAEIAEMEAILQAHKIAMPERQVLVSLAEKFSNSEERSGKIEVQMKQVWNWFQNRRYAIRAKAAKSPGKLSITQMQRDDSGMVKGVVPQATQPLAASSATVRSLPQVPQHQHPTVPSASVRTFPQAPQHPPAFSVQTAGRVTDNSQMEYEAKSARDGAWYDVSTFLAHRSLETGDPEALVRFAGFGAEEDEWVNVRKNVRQRSLPCESSECVAVLPADLILCFQEGKEQALYFDAHVLDAQRRRHDVRGCRCRFLVRYDHDQSEEIVALRKICRRPETDYRLQQLHAVNESLSANQNKNGATNNIHTVSTLRVYPPAEVQPKQPMVQPSTAEVQPKQHKVEPIVQPSTAETPQKRQRLDSPVAPEGSEKQLKVEPNVQQKQHSVQPAMPAPSPEGSQMQLKVEPALLSAPPGFVPQNQHSVQPAMAATSPKVPHQHKVESVAPATSAQPLVGSQKVEPVEPVSLAQNSVEKKNVVPVEEVQVEMQKLQPVVHAPSDQASQEPKKVEPMVPVSSAEEIAESKNVVPVDEVQVEVQKVQPVMHDSSNEVSIEVETGVSFSGEAKQEVQTEEHDKAVGPKVAEPQKEALVSRSSVDVQAELHEVQPDVPDQPHASAVETKPEEPVMPVSTNDPNVFAEAKTEEPVGPVSTNEPNVVEEAKTEEPVGPVSTNEPNVVKEAKTGEPVGPVSTNEPIVVETKTEEPVEPVSTIDHNMVEEVVETKTKEPVVPVSSNDPNVVDEAKTEELVPTNDTTMIKAEIEQPKVMDSNENRAKTVEDNVNNVEKVENSDIGLENEAVAMEEG